MTSRTTGPGKSHREGVSLVKLLRMFPDDATAQKWFESVRWPKGPFCPKCGSFNVQSGIAHKTMTHRCRDCEGKPRFSVKTGTPMQSSKLGYQIWAFAIYEMTSGIKGVSSMHLHRKLEITQKSAWHLAHRIRKSYEVRQGMFYGPVEVDETFIGGREKNKHGRKKLRAGRGGVGKEIVAGAKDRQTGRVNAAVVKSSGKDSLRKFIKDRVIDDSEIFTDEHGGYNDLPFYHQTVNHSAGEYVDGEVHTNGIESFWASFKRGHMGIYHKMSKKHLDLYVTEYAERHNIRDADTIDQMRMLAKRMAGKRLKYATLISENGKPSGANPTAQARAAN